MAFSTTLFMALLCLFSISGFVLESEARGQISRNTRELMESESNPENHYDGYDGNEGNEGDEGNEGTEEGSEGGQEQKPDSDTPVGENPTTPEDPATEQTAEDGLPEDAGEDSEETEEETEEVAEEETEDVAEEETEDVAEEETEDVAEEETEEETEEVADEDTEEVAEEDDEEVADEDDEEVADEDDEEVADEDDEDADEDEEDDEDEIDMDGIVASAPGPAADLVGEEPEETCATLRDGLVLASPSLASILEIVAAPGSGDFADALDSTDLNVTVLLPTDELLAILASAVEADASINPEIVQGILEDHIIAGAFEAEDLLELEEGTLDTISEEDIELEVVDGDTVNFILGNVTATVVEVDKEGCSGESVIHRIDTIFTDLDLTAEADVETGDRSLPEVKDDEESAAGLSVYMPAAIIAVVAALML